LYRLEDGIEVFFRSGYLTVELLDRKNKEIVENIIQASACAHSADFLLVSSSLCLPPCVFLLVSSSLCLPPCVFLLVSSSLCLPPYGSAASCASLTARPSSPNCHIPEGRRARQATDRKGCQRKREATGRCSRCAAAGPSSAISGFTHGSPAPRKHATCGAER
jgi:hypothetical protein